MSEVFLAFDKQAQQQVLPARASIVSAPAQLYSNTLEGDEHGHKQGDDQPVGNNSVIMLNNVSTFGGSVSPLSSR